MIRGPREKRRGGESESLRRSGGAIEGGDTGPSTILALQRSIGNAAVVRIMRQAEASAEGVHPVNFRLASHRALPNGGLETTMTWGSSTGSTGDLYAHHIEMRERVTYAQYPPPNPPFTRPFSSRNPVELPLSAFHVGAGTAPDSHVGYADTLLKVAGTTTARQVYEYRVGRGAWIPLASFTITRSVYQRRGRWHYRVAKAGVFGTVWSDVALP